MPDKRQKSYKRSKSRSKKSKKGTRKRTTKKIQHRKRSRNIMRGGVNMVSFDELNSALNKNRAGKNAMTDFIEKYVDRDMLFKAELENKLNDFFGALKWEMASAESQTAKKFFEF